MDRRSLLAALLVASLVASAAPALAEGGEVAGHGGDRGTSGSQTGSPTDSQAGSQAASPRGDAGGDGGEHAAAREAQANLTRAQSEGRDAFQSQVQDAQDACERLQASDRAACERNVTAVRRDFEAEQRAAFEQALAELVNTSAPDQRLGGFAFVNGTWQGRFVSFAWDAANGTVRDYTVGGVLVFDAVRVANATGGAPALGEYGRLARLDLGNATLQLHDNPGGVLNAQAGRGAVAFDVDPALNASLGPDGLTLLGPGNFSATLHGQDLALANGTATARREATFVAHEPDPVLPDVANAHRSDIEAAKADQRVGAEITVAGPGGADVDTQVLDAPLNVDVTNATDGMVRVVLNGTGLGPRTIVLNVAASVLPGDRLNITYQDLVNHTWRNVPILQADSLADVLDPGAHSVPVYWVVHDRDGVQVLVAVPHFSTHAFEVQGLPALVQELPPSVLGGVAAAAVFVAVAGFNLLGRRRAR